MAPIMSIFTSVCLSVYLPLFVSIAFSLSLSEFQSVLLDFSLTVKAATLIFISGCGSANSSAKEVKSGFIL